MIYAYHDEKPALFCILPSHVFITVCVCSKRSTYDYNLYGLSLAAPQQASRINRKTGICGEDNTIYCQGQTNASSQMTATNALL